MMNFRKIAAASSGKLLLRYFTENTPEPIHRQPVDAAGRQLDAGGRLTAYYTSRDSRAAWRPDISKALAEAAGINPSQAPRDADLARLFEGKRADNGEAWSRHPRKLSGFDIVFSPHKSVTLAAEFAATPAESAAILHAVDRASDEAMRYVARTVGWARRGPGGQDGADPGAVGWASFRHHTARPTLQVQDGKKGPTYLTDAPVAGDPHFHIHHFLLNLVVTDSGRVGSLDTRALTDARVKEFGAYFQAVLADELRRLGIRTRYDALSQAVVVSAIPETVSKAFSKGRQQVLGKAKAYAQAQGMDWDSLGAEAKMDILRDAGADGRLGKMKSDERRIWREQAAALGWVHKTVMGEVVHDPAPDRDRHEAAYEFAARRLDDEFHTAAVITYEKLGLYAARGLIGTGIAGGIDDIRQVVRMLEERGIRVNGEAVALVVGLFDDQVRVTNTGQIKIEQRLAALSRETAARKDGALSAEALRGAIRATGVAFSPEQRAAIHALGEGGAITLLTGVAGAGKTTLLQPLVAAWKDDVRFQPNGREVIGAAMAWRQANALQESGIDRTFALDVLLRKVAAGELQFSRNTVLVLDEVSQIAPRPLLKLIELQATTGMTIKMLGDREQAQAIEAGDSIEILRRALPPEAMPELLTTMRQRSRRAREIASLFREGEAAAALAMKREDGHARLLGGDHGQVVEQIAEMALARRDALRASGSTRGVTITAPTNDDAAEISMAIRRRLQSRGEIAADEVVYKAVDQRGQEFNLPIADGDKVRLFRQTWGRVDGKMTQVGNNGDVLEVVQRSAHGLRVRNADGMLAQIDWDRLRDRETGRLLLGFGHALTIDAAQGITSDEHINALPRGTSTITSFTTYVAESRSKGLTWTLIAEGAVYEAERHRQALGDITPITTEDLWTRVAEDMSRKPYKALGSDLLEHVQRGREAAVDTFIAASHDMETAALENPNVGRDAVARMRARAVNETLEPHLTALHAAAEKNTGILTSRPAASREIGDHLKALWAEAAAARHAMNQEPAAGPTP